MTAASAYLARKSDSFHLPRWFVVLMLAGIVVFSGFLGLAGWYLDIMPFRAIQAEFATMKANTAASFLLAGIVLVLLAYRRGRFGLWSARLIAALITALGLVSITQDVFGFDIGIDQILVRETDSAVTPGRMSPGTALCFIVFGIAASISNTRHGVGLVLRDGLSCFGLLFALLPLVTYFYDYGSLYKTFLYHTMALRTAMTFVFAFAGLLLLNPNTGIMRIVTSPDAGGVAARRLLPSILATPIVTGFLTNNFLKENTLGRGLAIALFAIVTIAFLLVVVLWIAWALDRLDRDRLAAHETALTARIEAEQANKAKTEFLAQMSHDLRTPLNAIIGFSGMMTSNAYGPLGDPKYEAYAHDIGNSGARLLLLVDTILDLSHVENGCISASDEVDIDVVPLVREIAEECRTAAIERPSIIRIEADDNLPLIRGDVPMIRRIVGNLIDNSIKFGGSPAEIRVCLSKDPGGSLTIEVSDTGPGIPKRFCSDAIEPYEGAWAFTTEDNPNGSGLGFRIVEKLVQLHGATLWIGNLESGGACVRVSFPPERLVSLA